MVSFGDRSAALKWIEEWFGQEVSEFLIICDQYFGPRNFAYPYATSSCTTIMQGISLNKLGKNNSSMRSCVNPGMTITGIIGGRMSAQFQNPPETDIIVVGTQSGKTPIHDRWWLTKGAGIAIGTSLNSLGRYEYIGDFSNEPSTGRGETRNRGTVSASKYKGASR